MNTTSFFDGAAGAASEPAAATAPPATTGAPPPERARSAVDTITMLPMLPGTSGRLGTYLVYVWKDRSTTRAPFEDGDEIVFGRSRSRGAMVEIEDHSVSRRHAVVRRAGDEVFVRDLGSRNGTRVRGEVIVDEERVLAPGDGFTIGPLHVVVATAQSRGGPEGAHRGARIDRELERIGSGHGTRAALVAIAFDPDAGPERLRAITDTLQDALALEEWRPGAYAALLDVASPEVLQAKLEGLERSLRGATIGVAHFPSDGTTARALWKRASTAFDGAKDEIDAGTVVADPVMQKVFALARRLGQTTTSVLILGDTGVGKEVIAEHIHRHSARRGAPYIRLNCASLPTTLLESELFGHERAAFTGAHSRKIGYIEAADGGTLLLDEVGELSLEAQVRLLRVLESRRVVRLGGTREVPVDIRVICATHRDLRAEIAQGRFRQDLYYRISAFTMRVPPLRERRTEIALLADVFIRNLSDRMGVVRKRLDPEAERLLVAYDWPGNVRELKNAMEHALVLADGATVRAEHLPEDVQGREEHTDPGGTLVDHLSSIERDTILTALAAEGDNQTRAAKRLGITRRALIYRMAKVGVR